MAENPDVFFQHREASNPYYDVIPEIVEEYINEINRITGRNYGLFDYYGDPEAEKRDNRNGFGYPGNTGDR